MGSCTRRARAHPEIGHHIVDWSGPLCYCGANGLLGNSGERSALEAWMGAQRDGVLSASQICELARQATLWRSRPSSVRPSTSGWGSPTGDDVLPADIVLGGGMMRSADLLLARHWTREAHLYASPAETRRSCSPVSVRRAACWARLACGSPRWRHLVG